MIVLGKGFIVGVAAAVWLLGAAPMSPAWARPSAEPAAQAKADGGGVAMARLHSTTPKKGRPKRVKRRAAPAQRPGIAPPAPSIPRVGPEPAWRAPPMPPAR